MSKVLLLDTAFSAIPIYKYLKESVDEVFVMGNRPSDPLVLMNPKNWINQDYSDIEKVSKLLEEYNFEYIVPGCTDLSIEVCQKINRTKTIFDAPETYNNLGNKKQFRELCKKLNLVSPQIRNIKDFPLEGYFICKPADSFSGRGISVVDGMNLAELKNAQKIAEQESPLKSALFEDFINGQLYSYTCFVENQKVKDSFIVIESSSVNPYAVDTSYVVTDFPKAIEDELKLSIESISTNLNLIDGLVHLQFMLSNNKAYLIEITRRCPGDLYSKLIEYSTGFDYAGKYASYFINKKYDTNLGKNDLIIRHTVSSERLSNYKALEFNESLKVKAFYPLQNLGAEILANQKTRVGILFAKSENKESDFEAFLSRNVYKI